MKYLIDAYGAMLLKAVAVHLGYVLVSVAIGFALGLVLGVLLSRVPRWSGIVLPILSVFQTIPGLVFIGVLFIWWGMVPATVIVALTVYAMFPVLKNTYTGILAVESRYVEAAKGCGMSPLQTLLQVELPLAMPSIVAGLRMAAIYTVSWAVLASMIGLGGLGSVITRGIRLKDMKTILSATLVLMVIAAALDVLMGVFEKQMHSAAIRGGGRKKLLAPLALLLAAFVLLVPFGTGGEKGDLYVYDLNYSEPQLLTRMVKMLVEDRTGLKVVIKDEMTAVNAFNELTAAQSSCDFIVSYDGTLLTTYLHQDTTDIPAGETLYDYANRQAMERYGVRMLGKFGLDNTYAIAVPEALAQQYGLNTVSDLVPIAGQLVFGAEHDFFTAEGSMKYNPFAAYYGLKFKDAVSVDISLKYNAIENGSFQVTEVYTTDGLNIKAGLKILEDDKNFFPEYNGTLLVRQEVLDEYADQGLEQVMNLLEGRISNEQMAQMTYQVDVEGRDVNEVARNFLVEQGLLAA